MINIIYWAKIYPASEEIKSTHLGLLSQNISYPDRQNEVNVPVIRSVA